MLYQPLLKPQGAWAQRCAGSHGNKCTMGSCLTVRSADSRTLTLGSQNSAPEKRFNFSAC